MINLCEAWINGGSHISRRFEPGRATMTHLSRQSFLSHAKRRTGRTATPYSTFSSFFAERETNSSSGLPLKYELRLLELEGRVLKLEGMNARSTKSLRSGGSKDASRTQSENNQILPDQEQLLLGCTFSGGVLGLLLGRALLSRQMYLGCIFGAVFGVYFSNKEGNFGAFIRALGKLTLYTCDRLAFAWQEFKFNWKAWRVYERSFKKLETLDKEMQVSEKIKAWDRQYRVSNHLNGWWKKFQTAGKTFEENLREQAVYWQRAQRLREEQKQAQLIQQELQRQQERERSRQTGGVTGAVAGGGGGSFQASSSSVQQGSWNKQQQQDHPSQEGRQQQVNGSPEAPRATARGNNPLEQELGRFVSQFNWAGNSNPPSNGTLAGDHGFE